MDLKGNAIAKEFRLQTMGRWLLLGLSVGCLTGLAAIAFHLGLQAARGFLLHHLAGLPMHPPAGEPPDFEFPLGPFRPILVVLLPAAGALLAGLIVYWAAPEAEGHGTDAAIQAYHRKQGLIRPRVPLIKMAASILTIGSGGSGGREGPIAQIGAGIGSLIATRLHLSVRMRRWLLAAGVGAGVGSIFRAPLAGALFAAEVLYSSEDVETEVLLPATVSSIVAYVVFSSYFGFGHMFEGAGAYGLSSPLEIAPYTILALVLVVAAFIYVKVFYGFHEAFRRIKGPLWLRAAIGGLCTGALALGCIYATGDPDNAEDILSSGYGVIQNIIRTDGKGIATWVLFLIAGAKILATSLSIGSGGSGGVFGPSMVIGATLGAGVGSALHGVMPDLVPHPTTYAIVGMAGFFAAAANTPISTVIMVSELTGNYELLMPALWVCALAFLAGRRWTLFRSQLPSRIHSPAHLGEYASEVLAQTHVGEVFNASRKFVSVRKAWTVEQVLEATERTRQRVFPVTDNAGHLVGYFTIDDLMHALHHPRQGQTVQDIMHSRVPSTTPRERVLAALHRMRSLHIEELLVVDAEDPKRVVGILTAADVMLAYSRRLAGRIG